MRRLPPGPAGALFRVIPTPEEAFNESTPGNSTAFARQMLYAVAMSIYERFRKALGRAPDWPSASEGNAQDRPLDLELGKLQQANAHYDPLEFKISFGHFPATRGALGRLQAGSLVRTALSHDIIAHEVSHVILDGQRPYFLVPTNRDVLAFHEGFSDLVALFTRFAHPQLVERALQRSGLRLTDSLLADLARELGMATKGETTGGLRTFSDGLNAADPGSLQAAGVLYHQLHEPHELGALLVCAVFEAFRVVFMRKTEPLMQLAGLTAGDRLPPALIPLLAAAARKLAEQFLDIAIRALDYLPPVDVTFGEYLRAMITADYDLVPDDPYCYREALIAAFRRFDIPIYEVESLDEQDLLWQPPTTNLDTTNLLEIPVQQSTRTTGEASPNANDRATKRAARADCVRKFLECNADKLESLGLKSTLAGSPIIIESIRGLRRISPQREMLDDFVIELVKIDVTEDGMAFFGGLTLIVSAYGVLRYAICKRVGSVERLQRQQDYLHGEGTRYREHVQKIAETLLLKTWSSDTSAVLDRIRRELLMRLDGAADLVHPA